MKVLFISFTSLLQKTYQHRVAEIASYCEDIRILTPPHWMEIWNNRNIQLEGKLMPDKHFTGSVLFTGNLHFAVFHKGLTGLIKDFRPDIIDMENEPFNLGSYQLLKLRKKYFPECRIVLHASQNKYKKYPPPFNFIEKYALKNADMIFARTQKAREILVEKGRSDNISIIPHGVDTAHFIKKDKSIIREKYGLAGALIVGFAGALTAQKGLDVLLRAVSEINDNIKVMIVGDGPEKKNIESLAGDLKISDKVVFTGACEHENIVDYLNTMDIFVLPSITTKRDSERFGRVIIEAMACELPVIGSTSGEIPEVIGDDGLIFSEGDQDELRGKIEILLNDENLRSDLGRKARQHVIEKFSWKVLARKSAEYYKKILDE